MPARGADPPGEQHFPASDQESGLLVEDGGTSADTNTAASGLGASTISMVEPTQLVQTNASSSGDKRNARENLKELKSLSQGLDQKDKQAKIRAKKAAGVTNSPTPGATSKKGRGEFPNEKFGATTRPAPNSNNSRQTSTASSNNSNSSRGLSNNAFPNQKFGRPRSTNPAAEPAEPAAASSSQVIVNHGQQVAPAYQPGQIQLGQSNRPMQDVEPTIHVEPTDPPPIVEETGNAQDDYLVEATLVSPKEEEEDRQDVGEVVEAQEVTLRDVLQIKGVRCLVGSVVGCFLLVLGILVVALVLLTSGGGGGSSDSATTTAETASAPLPPTMSPTIEFAATSATSVAATTMAPTFMDGDDSSTSDLFLTEPPLVALPEQPAPAEPVTAPQVTSPPVSAPATEEERGTLGPTTQVFTQEFGDTFAPAPAAIPESDEGGTSEMQPDDSQADDKEGTDPAIIAIIVTAVIVAVAMIAFVPAFLMYMKRKLQMEHHKKRHSMACQKGAASEL